MTNDYQLNDGVLTVAPGTAYIRSQQFAQRDDIREVIIPQGVGFMEDECFAECPELERVILPEGLINIGPASFADCPKLRSINIPTSVVSIDSGAFIFCGELKSIVLPEGLETVSEYAFQNTGLETVTIPATVRSIGEYGFFSCEELRRADILGADTEIGMDAFGCDPRLVEGYIAPGYPRNADSAAELLFTLLWCSCPERHSAAICARAERFIGEHQSVIMEHILKENNLPAMTTLAQRSLLSARTIEESLEKTLISGQTELTALLLKAKNIVGAQEGEFEL